LLATPLEEVADDHGQVFTRDWVVELILDLCGYVKDRDLAGMVAVEPACGSGAFLIPMVDRLISSATLHGRRVEDATGALRATDLLPANIQGSRQAVRRVLTEGGVAKKTAALLARAWVTQSDFLLDPPHHETADFVIGNPPYIRLESVPAARSGAYRAACTTMGGRADVYVGFYERGLLALKTGGTLGFICADRWMRNAYGRRLRAMISSGWSVEAIVSMTDVDAFEEEVDAYPAITVLRRALQSRGPLVVDTTPEFDHRSARKLIRERPHRAGTQRKGCGYRVTRLPTWTGDLRGWPHGSPERLSAIADMESRLPTLENALTATRLGIGVATGADRVFITSDPDLVEPQRRLPLALPRDLASGQVQWSGKYLVNPWDRDGLVDLDEWPRMARHLGFHKAILTRRHTARGGKWHKTIDRVIEGLVGRPKLYIQDFGATISPALDTGETYPHHNLYWITSDAWDLSVLGGLLMSEVANMFIAAYSVRMRGGYLRFQAQYLRRIRVPPVAAVNSRAAKELALAFHDRDQARATKVALSLYGLAQLPR
jgi:adenine-specific DNA-methyltransferase